MKNHSKYNISFRAKENREITRKEALIKLENTLQLLLTRFKSLGGTPHDTA